MWEPDAKKIFRPFTTTVQQHFAPVLDSKVLGANYILFWCIIAAAGYPVVFTQALFSFITTLFSIVNDSKH